MSRQTRRTFLATVGVAGTAGCTGIINDGGDNKTSTTDPGTESPSGETTTGNGGNDPGTTTEDPGGGGNGPQTLYGFEKLGQWRVQTGKMTKHTKDPYEGSQAARLKGDKKTNAAYIKFAPVAHGDSKPLDLRGKNLSIAFKSLSHDSAKLDVTLGTDTGQVRMNRTLAGPKNRWVRLNLGASSIQGGAQLSKVWEIHITARPRDGADSSTPIHALVDDLKVVEAPKKGAVMLTFDDSARSHYTVAFKKMQKHNIPGVDAVIAESIGGGDNQRLTWSQMRKMTNKGNWDMISHPNTGDTPMPEQPKSKQSQLMGQSKYQLKAHGFSGAKYMAVPKNALGKHTFDLAMKKYKFTMSFGASNNALPFITKDALASRFYVNNDVQLAKRKIDEAAKLNQLAIPLFHGIGTQNGISKQNFDKVLKHIKKRRDEGKIQVVTPSMLEKQGLLI